MYPLVCVGAFLCRRLAQVLLAFAGSGTFAFGRSILADLTPPEVRGVRGVA
jgi:hypothetical protein